MKKILSISAVALLLSGCNFLDEINYTELSADTFFSSAENVEYAVNGCYDALQPIATQFVTMTETPADYVCIAPGKKNANESRWMSGVFSYTDQWPTAVWNNMYSLIYSCNLVIDNIDKVSMSETLHNRYVAEARFIRGWAYLMLTNAFKDVPLRTTSVYQSTNYDCPVTSQDGIYKFLLEDLEYAEKNLYDFASGQAMPDSKGTYADAERMRADVNTAIGMQALAYLYRAGNDSASPYWEMARDKAKQLIERCGGLDGAASWLNSSYGALFRNEGKYHKENLFAIYFDGSTKSEGSNLPNAWAIMKYYSKAQSAGYRRFTNDWYTKHFGGVKDNRNIDMLSHEFQNDKGVMQFWPANKNQFETEIGHTPSGSAMNGDAAGPWNHKYNDETASGAGMCSTGLPLLRYADVLLVYAEAECEVNGAPTADAYKALNAVRTRAGVANAPDSMDKDAFITYVLEEREREFFGEGKRLFDLNRRKMYGTAVSATANAVEFTQSGAEVNRIRNYDQLYFAIPQDEVKANGSIQLQ